MSGGGSSQIRAERLLLEHAFREGYDYVHLISSQDMPLLTAGAFRDFFTEDLYLGFMEEDDKKRQHVDERIRFWWPTERLDIRKVHLTRLTRLVNRLFRVNRLQGNDIQIEKGTNWFSMSRAVVPLVLEFDIKMFEHSYCSDELYVQMAIGKERGLSLSGGKTKSGRLIDWDRGSPYTFTIEDVPFLRSNVNRNFAFARKVANPEIVRAVFAQQ